MDESLNSLLRAEQTRRVLGTSHCDLVTYALVDPALGWNLRNEVAHGTVRPDALTATRVLLTWLFVVRLTCFVVRPTSGQVEAGDEPDANEEAPAESGRPEPPPAEGGSDG
jgi:hypothetical protein